MMLTKVSSVRVENFEKMLAHSRLSVRMTNAGHYFIFGDDDEMALLTSKMTFDIDRKCYLNPHDR